MRTLKSSLTSRFGLTAAVPLAVVAAITFDAASSPPVQSSFDVDDEGWIVADLNCDNYNIVVATSAVQWLGAGGNTGGYISSVDPSNQCFFFDAPSEFLGDQSIRIGGSIQFSVRTTLSNYQPGSILVLIGNGGEVIVHDFPQPPEDLWQTYLVPLHHETFRLNNASGPVVDEAEFTAILSDLEAVRISGEYGSIVEETSNLDSVCLRSEDCLADLTCSGSVGVPDLLALLACWGPVAPASNCVSADLTGSGTVGVPDLLKLLANWGSCR